MNQIIKKRRLSPLETAIFGNVIYILLVLVFKNIFDAIGTSSFNYSISILQLVVIGLFWIGLFSISFKNIFAGDKKRYFAYVFYTLLPILVLTVAVTLVTIFSPGETSTAIWNQFTFLAAPTIFWYLPYGIIYQLIGPSITIFVLFGIGLAMTILFQIIGIVFGRILGRKYWIETKAESKESQMIQEKKETAKKRRKKRRKEREFIGMDKISDEVTSESFRPKEPERMTQVIIDHSDESRRNISAKDQKEKLFQRVSSNSTKDNFERVAAATEKPYESQGDPVKPATIPILEEADRIGENIRINEELIMENDEHAKDAGKSFLMDTSQVKIIDEEDINQYHQDKK